MGLSDVNSAAALFRDIAGEFVRRDSTNGQVPANASGTIEIALSEADSDFVIVTSITSLEEFEQVTQQGKNVGLFKLDGTKRRRLEPNQFPWNNLFFVGYVAH